MALHQLGEDRSGPSIHETNLYLAECSLEPETRRALFVLFHVQGEIAATWQAIRQVQHGSPHASYALFIRKAEPGCSSHCELTLDVLDVHGDNLTPAGGGICTIDELYYSLDGTTAYRTMGAVPPVLRRAIEYHPKFQQIVRQQSGNTALNPLHEVTEPEQQFYERTTEEGLGTGAHWLQYKEVQAAKVDLEEKGNA